VELEDNIANTISVYLE